MGELFVGRNGETVKHEDVDGKFAVPPATC